MEVVGLYDKITNQLLDLLDIAVNANSLLISFDINENVRDLEGFSRNN